ncbi:hypothetical protein RND81_01G221100 [Saponaria officinalis]|uniref:pyridoxal 5'-phosphate synthase n=1 Tax=Saponaria officinalis TaxID=3572 RepID=A0AAW1NI00_SAPOF
MEGKLSELVEDQVELNPFDQFRRWFDDAIATGSKDAKLVAVSTVSKEGKPSSRMVILNKFDEDGFVWYTSYESQKGVELSENPNAALLFYWGELSRQVRVEGTVEKVSEEESEQCFKTRPRGNQIGATATVQSSVVPGRQYLQEMFKEVEDRFSNGAVIPKPEHWGGYRLKPEVFEFWQAQPPRPADRLRYSTAEIDGSRVWKIDRLAP